MEIRGSFYGWKKKKNESHPKIKISNYHFLFRVIWYLFSFYSVKRKKKNRRNTGHVFYIFKRLKRRKKDDSVKAARLTKFSYQFLSRPICIFGDEPVSPIDLPFWYSCEFSRKDIKRFGEGKHDEKFEILSKFLKSKKKSDWCKVKPPYFLFLLKQTLSSDSVEISSTIWRENLKRSSDQYWFGLLFERIAHQSRCQFF